MAAVQQQDTLKDRLCDEKYKNWLKAALCIFRVKEGLESFVTQESDALHQKLLAISNPCGNCVQDDLEKKKKLCSDCEKFKGEIKKSHKSQKPIWKNTNVQNWSQDHWSVARCFMNPGQPQHASAADADSSALLNFIIHCKIFSNQGTYGDIQDHAEKVREHRNDIFHRGEDKVKKRDLDDWTKDMIQLLKNENPDGKLKTNAEAKKALTDIKEVLNEDFKITLKDENTVKIASLEAQMDEAKTCLQEHSEKLQKLQKDSTSQGQKVETLTKDVDTIQATIEKIHLSLDNVRNRQTMTDGEVSKITANMKDEFKSVWDQFQRFEVRLNTFESDLKDTKERVEKLTNTVETLQNEKSKTKTTDLSRIQKNMIASYKPHLKIQLNPVFLGGGTSKDLGDFYTKIILEKEHEERLEADGKIQNKMTEQIKSFRQLSWKANARIYRIALKGKSGLGKSTFLKPVFLGGGTSKDLGDFYTNIILGKEHEERLEADGKIQNKMTEQIKSFRQLFWKATAVPIYRIALKGKAGLGKSTFLKLLLKTWCTFHNNRLNKASEGLMPTLNDELEDGHVMLKFDILLFVNLGKISDEKNIIDVIYKQIPVLDTGLLPRDNLDDLMSKPDDNKVLMLMDALDEMDVSAPSIPCIEQIIKGVKYPTMTVIVASRPWKIDRLHQSEPLASIDLLIDMKGFSEENGKLFAEKILNCYKDVDKTVIKQFWDGVSQNDIAKTLICIPILALLLVQVWHKDKSFPQTDTQLYLKMLDIIGKRYEEKTREKRKDTPNIYPVEKLKMFPKLQNLSITKIIGEENLLACCNIAYQFLSDEKQESPLKDAEVLDHFGNDGELKRQLALNIGLVSQDDCTEGDDDNRKVSVSFPHRTIQELLAAISLCCVQRNFTHFLDRLKTYHDVLENETIITFIAGISTQQCETLFEKIYETCDDKSVYERLHKDNCLEIFSFWNRHMDDDLCKLCMKCVRETEKSTHFRLKHLYIDSSEKLNAIVPCIKNIPDIRTLTLLNIDFTSDNCKGCFNIFECDNLECLALSYIKLEDIDWKWLTSGLSLLVLDDVTMSSMCSELLYDTLSQCTKLKKLILKDVKLGNGKLDLSDASCLSRLWLEKVTISSLSLSQCSLNSLTLKDVKLGDDKLDLSDASSLDHLSLEKVTISSLNLLKCTNLKKLRLKDVKLGDDKLDLSDASSLDHLSLEKVTISSLNLSKCTNLKKLTLKDVKLNDDKLDLQDNSCLFFLELEKITISSLHWSKCSKLQLLTLKDVKLGDDKLDLSDASSLDHLSLEKVTISSLNLSKCTNLKKLRLKDVKLGDDKLDLSDASSLDHLSLEKVTISSLNLSKCTNLRKLRLKDVKLNDDKLDLQDNSCLFFLELEKITISSLHWSKCSKLQLLTLKDVKLGDDKLDLSDASSLDHLSLEKVTISSLNLSKCTNLKKLTLKDVKLSDDKLDLQDNSCLFFLELEKITISSLHWSKCTKLQWLTLKDVKLGDDKLDLSDASSLDHLSLEKVTISSLNLSKCTNLKKLTLEDVKLSDDKLDLQDNSCLFFLELEKIIISSLHWSKCTKLQWLTLKDVKLGDDKLDLSDASSLDHLSLEKVTISSLNLSKCTNLKKLTLEDVKLSDDKLDLQDNSCLFFLELEKITISSLHWSKCSKLQRLTLKDVKLGDDKLDLSDASSLDHLSLEKVTISSLNLSKCTNLKKLTLKDVKLSDDKLDLQDNSCLFFLELEKITISSLHWSKCTKLQWLTLKDVKLGDDKLDLPDASSLDHLSLEKVTISSLHLSKCTNLQELTPKKFKLGDKDDTLDLDFQDYSCLYKLHLENVTISSFNLSQCTNLNWLTLKDVKLPDDKLDLQDYSCLSGLKLENLTISCLNLSKGTNLLKLTLKDVVNLGDNKLDLSVASSLYELSLEKVTISSLNLSKYTNLKKLTLKDVVKLGDDKLDLSVASSLYELSLEKVTISSLSLSKCTNLLKLTLKDVVKLGDDKLDLSVASSLYELSLEKVTISSLNLSKCTNLLKLTLKDVAKLGDDKLDLSVASSLYELSLEKVTISSLNLSKCTNLLKLTLKDVVKLGDDQLDLSDAFSLSPLMLETVAMFSLNLSKYTNLKELTLKDVILGHNKLDFNWHRQ